MGAKNPKKSARYNGANILRAFGAHCRKLRKSRGYSIDRLSKEADQLSSSVVQRLETGSGAVTVASVFKFAQTLGVPLREVMDFPGSGELHRGQLPVGGRGGTSLGPPVVTEEDLPKGAAFKSHLPVYSLKAAAGRFGDGEVVEPEGWVRVDQALAKLSDKLFVARAKGRSMEPMIQDGDLLVFRLDPVGSRQGKIVLAQNVGPADPESGGSYTVKKYLSVKRYADGGEWAHQEITLAPLNPEYEPIVLSAAHAEQFKILAELVTVLGAG